MCSEFFFVLDNLGTLVSNNDNNNYFSMITSFNPIFTTFLSVFFSDVYTCTHIPTHTAQTVITQSLPSNLSIQIGGTATLPCMAATPISNAQLLYNWTKDGLPLSVGGRLSYPTPWGWREHHHQPCAVIRRWLVPVYGLHPAGQLLFPSYCSAYWCLSPHSVRQATHTHTHIQNTHTHTHTHTHTIHLKPYTCKHTFIYRY